MTELIDNPIGLVIAFCLGGLVGVTWLAMNPRAVKRLGDWLDRLRRGWPFDGLRANGFVPFGVSHTSVRAELVEAHHRSG